MAGVGSECDHREGIFCSEAGNGAGETFAFDFEIPLRGQRVLDRLVAAHGHGRKKPVGFRADVHVAAFRERRSSEDVSVAGGDGAAGDTKKTFSLPKSRRLRFRQFQEFQRRLIHRFVPSFRKKFDTDHSPYEQYWPAHIHTNGLHTLP